MGPAVWKQDRPDDASSILTSRANPLHRRWTTFRPSNRVSGACQWIAKTRQLTTRLASVRLGSSVRIRQPSCHGEPVAPHARPHCHPTKSGLQHKMLVFWENAHQPCVMSEKKKPLLVVLHKSLAPSRVSKTPGHHPNGMSCSLPCNVHVKSAKKATETN